jgi:hypothetical protein
MDVLDIISKTLDFDDHFQFGGVCKNWRAFHQIYWRNFLASQEPLLLQIAYDRKTSYSFITIPDQKVYCLKRMEYFLGYTHVASSSGYFIMANYHNNSLMLVNPFTRKKKLIHTPTSESNYFIIDRAFLAFGKCSEEFILVVLSNRCLHVYQSRNCGWATYSIKENYGRVVDFAVLHNIIYVVTRKANIGVLSLNYANIRFLKLKSTPDVPFHRYLRLVNCDEQLLVVDLTWSTICNVYKIDFTTMNYVELKTLGDIALLYVGNLIPGNCYALSNPNRWGYESNSMYVNSHFSTTCNVYSGDDKKKLQKCITLPAPNGTSSFTFDWHFRNLRSEVDYSLVE